MALTNSQYDAIMRTYEEKQYRLRNLRQERLDYLRTKLPNYHALEQQIAALSVEQGRRLLNGEEEAAAELKTAIQELISQKEALLLSAGLPAGYPEVTYDCPDCQDTGYIGSRKCHCFQQQMISLLYEQSHLEESIKKDCFDRLSYDYYEGEELLRFQKCVQLCHKFIDCFDSDYHNLFFYGTVGTGKSFLSHCIAKELIDSGHSVIYFSAANLFERISRFSYNYDNKEDLSDLYEDIYSCDLLIIDDLGTEVLTNFSVSHFFTILNERLLRKKPVIISTNLTLQELQGRYSDRISSRILSNYDLCKFTGPDIRIAGMRAASRK